MRILSCGIQYLSKDKFRPVLNTYFDLNKPIFGLWGSTYLPDKKYKSDWLRFINNRHFHLDKFNKAISFTLYRSANIYEVNYVEDYFNLLEKYYIIEHDDGDIRKYIDFEKLSKDYDAFHLTEEAFWKMKSIYNTDYADFYCYSCETWIMFNLDCINLGSIQNHRFNYKGEQIYE